MKQVLATPDAPPALGPYAQGVKVDKTVYVSGQLPIDPRTGKIVEGSIAVQAERVLRNMQAILEEGEALLEDVVKVTIYLKDLSNFDEVNRIYAIFFNCNDNSHCLPPARATVEVSRLPKDAEIEMDCIAVISGGYKDIESY